MSSTSSEDELDQDDLDAQKLSIFQMNQKDLESELTKKEKKKKKHKKYFYMPFTWFVLKFLFQEKNKTQKKDTKWFWLGDGT